MVAEQLTDLSLLSGGDHVFKTGVVVAPCKHSKLRVTVGISPPHAKTDYQTSNQTFAESLVYQCTPAALVAFPSSFPFGGVEGGWVIIRRGNGQRGREWLPLNRYP